MALESATKLIEVIRKLKNKTMEAARANRGIDAQEGGPGRELPKWDGTDSTGHFIRRLCRSPLLACDATLWSRECCVRKSDVGNLKSAL
ncbi:hypothetical protein CVT26_010404 [Gymnopilus dilepis]|uniref:Uncharacterized protein n=1 Tax=Gymnopilus dilepis TaxID=231916 RepID=A0A409VZ53_9AGAR|nr:hypothetical protein CVT26_010404 [Gymnopilus dilepis]